MRDDFAKQLVERERIHSRDHYHNYRNVRGPKGAWNDEEVGGREKMRVRYNHGYDRKSFNENLNPLKRWLHSCLGKKWDKCYSELRKTFDARSVVNNHILEHLFDFVEVNTKLVDGVVMVLEGYSGSQGYVPLKKRQYNMRWPSYYVCPKDGTLKTMHKPSRRSVEKQREADERRKRDAVFRVLDDKTHLRLVDGVWYAFGIEPLPAAEYRFEPPAGKTLFRVAGFGDNARMRTWDQLNEQEKRNNGNMVITKGLVHDVFLDAKIYRPVLMTSYRGRMFPYGGRAESPAGRGVYYATKKTASHKQLKQVGLAE